MKMRGLILVLRNKVFEAVNNFFIPQSLYELGIDVILGDVNSLQILDGEVVVRSTEFSGSAIGEPHPLMNDLINCCNFDFCWFLDYPHPKDLASYFQLLWVLERKVPFVNSPASVFMLNNKIGALGLNSSRYFPPTSVCKEVSLLREKISSSKEDTWVLKSPDKDGGADVFLLRSGDPNLHTLIDSAVGNPRQIYGMFGRENIGSAERYAVMQEFLPDLREEENRVLIAGGKIVGGYRKIASESDFRGNSIAGSSEKQLSLTSEMKNMSLEIASELLKYGIAFAGLDISRNFLIEINLVNPGGISGHLEATGDNIGKKACADVLRYLFPNRDFCM